MGFESFTVRVKDNEVAERKAEKMLPEGEIT